MGYRTQFWTSDEEAPACVKFTEKDYGDGYLEAGGFEIPILWSMCFSSADVCVQLREPDPDDHDTGPSLCASCDTTRVNALARLERRMPSLLKLIPENTREVTQVFLEKLRCSTASFVHLELSVHVAENEPSDAELWRQHWGKLLDGFDVPVSTVRTGMLRYILGTGVPADWKSLCRHANRQWSGLFKPLSMTIDQVAGDDVPGLQRWQA